MPDSESPTECCADLSAKLDDWKSCAERSVRDEPVKTAVLAFVAGLFLNILPVGRILAGLVQLSFALLRPALFVLGVVKAAEYFNKRDQS